MTTGRTKYVALGDSTGVGVGAEDGRGYVHRVASALGAAAADQASGANESSGVALANLCVSGATSSDVLARQIPRLEGFRREATRGALFTLLVGVNDLWRGVTPATFGQTYKSIVTRMRQVGGDGARIYVASLPDMRNAPAAFVVEQTVGVSRLTIATRVLSFNNEIERVARETGVVFVNLAAESLEGKDDLFSADGFHPSSAGYEKLAHVFLDSMAGGRAQESERCA